MHIKNIIIQGFKTYKDRTAIPEFDAHHNVILGKNGSGKSNIFEAIQFVLSDKYSNLRSEERQKLLHEGSGREVMSASVEIIFDNSDNRFPEDRPEVSIKRSIGLKKDEYFLNNQHMSKAEIVDLLESTGMSRSNPYYIVQQGRVQALIKMKNTERLDLLKEIAGTKIYDERRKESLKIMKDTDNRRERIQDVITYIETRLRELEDEKEELGEYQDVDSKRRCLEYTIYDHEMKAAQIELENYDRIREQSSDKSSDAFDQAGKAEMERREAEESLKSLQDQLAKDKSKREHLSKFYDTLIQVKSSIELTQSDIRNKLESDEIKLNDITTKLNNVNLEIKDNETKKQLLESTCNDKVNVEQEIETKVNNTQQRLAELYAKRGRMSQFSDKKSRDKYLKTEIKDITTTITDQKRQLHVLSDQHNDISKQIKELDLSRGEVIKQMKLVKDESNTFNTAIEKLNIARDKASDERKEAWREEAKLDESTGAFESAVEKEESNVSYMMNKDMYRGIQMVRRVVEENNIKGVHGMLMELFSCEPTFQRCVETTARAKLFNFVVDNDEIATRIIKHLSDKNTGRVTFVPLNRIKPKQYQYPNSPDVIPMINKLVYESKYEKAMTQVFGSTLIARDLGVASTYAREHSFNAVTLDGDEVDRKGALSGGFVDNNRSTLAAMAKLKEARLEMVSSNIRRAAIKETLERADEEVTQLMAQIQKLREEKTHLRRKYIQHESDVASITTEIANLEHSLVEKQKLKKTVEDDIIRCNDKIKAMQEEMQGDLVDELTQDEKEELRNLTSELDILKESLVKAQSERVSAEGEKQSIEDLLTNNLLKQKREYDLFFNTNTKEDAEELLESKERELRGILESIKETEDELTKLGKSLDANDKELRNHQLIVDELKKDETTRNSAVAKESKSLEKLLSQRTLQLQRIENCYRKIRELGSLPQEAFKNYVKWSEKKIMKELEVCNKTLKKFSHVNKKALDQYVTFTTQRSELLVRQEGLDTARASIIDLIESLDMKKDQAIERTFKNIAKNFSEVFEELVPGGKGKLVMFTKQQDDEDSDDEQGRKKGRSKKRKLDDQVGTQQSMNNYSGIGIKVSFTGSEQSQLMQELSGGQQSIVALSLIFAIQRCDPSPFYLFDEIDSALDTVHRMAVAKMIQRESRTTQFITTTFRPEMLATADRFYGVVFKNKCSKVGVITPEESQHLIVVADQPLPTGN